MQRLPKRSWQVYQDFQAPNFPTPAEPDDQTDGALIAYNRTHTAEVPTELGTAVAGHPGIVKIAFDAAGNAIQRINIRAGQKSKLKDWKRFGITLKTDDSSGSTGYYLGFGSSVNNPTYAMFLYNYQPGSGNVTIQRGVGGDPQYAELYNDDFLYLDTENIIESDPTLVDWHTLEVELDYPNRRATYFINGKFAGMVTVEEAQWSRDFHPFIQLNANKTANIYIDELAFSTLAWETEQSERIADPQDYDLHEDFITPNPFLFTSTEGSTPISIPDPVAGHPGLIRLTSIDDGAFGDAMLGSFAGAAKHTVKPRDLKRFTVVMKPEVANGSVDYIELCGVQKDGNNGFFIVPTDFGPYASWYVNYKLDGVTVSKNIALDLATLPDGDTWFKVECQFDYSTLTIKVFINDVPCAELTPPDAWWNLVTHLNPVYLYTERATTTDFKCLVDEVAVEFQPDATDERPETDIRDLDSRERYNTNTTRTDNF